MKKLSIKNGSAVICGTVFFRMGISQFMIHILYLDDSFIEVIAINTSCDLLSVKNCQVHEIKESQSLFENRLPQCLVCQTISCYNKNSIV